MPALGRLPASSGSCAMASRSTSPASVGAWHGTSAAPPATRGALGTSWGCSASPPALPWTS
eukprot:13440803-Alexandrium_andersonii.AAC.1